MQRLSLSDTRQVSVIKEMALTNVFYYVPEDNESADDMNYFKIQKAPGDVRLHDIQKYFPLPGDYHFRFQFKYQGQLVWLDLSNEEGSLPQVDGLIFMKVSRKKWNRQEKETGKHNLQ